MSNNNYTIDKIKELINKKINNENTDEYDYEKSKKILKKHLKNEPNNAELLLILGIVEYEEAYYSEEYNEAIKIFTKLFDFNDKDDKTIYYLASLYNQCTNDNEVNEIKLKIINLLENAIKLNDNDSEYYYLIGKINFNIENYKKAIDYYNKAAVINNTKIICNHKNEYYYELGKTYFYLKDYNNAIEAFKKSYEVSNQSQSLHYLGLSYEHIQLYDKAIENYKKALDIEVYSNLEDFNYDDLYAMKSMYDLYKKLGKNDEALNMIKKYMENDLSIILNISSGHDFKGSETHNDIMKIYNEIIEQGGLGKYSLEECYEGFADFCFDNEEFQKAIEMYSKLPEKNYENIAEAYKQLKDYNNAIETYKELIKISPDYDIYYSDIAKLYKKIKNYKEAINFYNKAIELDGDVNYYFISVADCYKELGKHEDAINFYNKAIEVDDIDYKGYKKLAQFYEDINEYDKAIEIYKNYLRKNKNVVFFNPNSVSALNNIAYLYNKLGNIKDRDKVYKLVIEKYKEELNYRELLPKKREIYCKELINIYVKIGDKEKAIETYNLMINYCQKSIDENKNYYEFLEYLGDLYLKFDDKENALKIYNKAISICIEVLSEYKNKIDNKKSFNYYIKSLSYLAFLYKKVPINDKCSHIYEELIKIYKNLITETYSPFNIFYLESIAELYIKLENKNKALEAYKKALSIYPDNDNIKEKINDIELGKEIKTADIFELEYRQYS